MLASLSSPSNTPLMILIATIVRASRINWWRSLIVSQPPPKKAPSRVEELHLRIDKRTSICALIDVGGRKVCFDQ